MSQVAKFINWIFLNKKLCGEVALLAVFFMTRSRCPTKGHESLVSKRHSIGRLTSSCQGPQETALEKTALWLS